MGSQSLEAISIQKAMNPDDPALKSQATLSSPRNILGSRFKKFEYKDENTGMLYPAEDIASPPGSHQHKIEERKPSFGPSRTEVSRPSSLEKNSKRSRSLVSGPNLQLVDTQYQILSRRKQNKEVLPGDPLLYDNKPPRVDYYDVFYFETRVRDMMEEYMVPFKESIQNDKVASVQLRYDYDCLLERLYELEHFALI